MKLSEYQAAALVTAQPRAFSLDYLVPMIVGEVGELFGQKAKAHWHGWEPERLQVELVSEFGDVCWGTAILLHVLDRGFVELSPESPRRRVQDHRDPGQILVQRAAYLHAWYSDEPSQAFLAGEAQSMWYTLEAHCEAITGMPFETVLQANLTKLAGRVERGTLVGSGDHR